MLLRLGWLILLDNHDAIALGVEHVRHLRFLLDVGLVDEESGELFVLHEQEEEGSLSHEDDDDPHVEEVDYVIVHVVSKVHVSHMNHDVNRCIHEQHEEERRAEDGRVAKVPDEDGHCLSQALGVLLECPLAFSMVFLTVPQLEEHHYVGHREHERVQVRN